MVTPRATAMMSSHRRRMASGPLCSLCGRPCAELGGGPPGGWLLAPRCCPATGVWRVVEPAPLPLWSSGTWRAFLNGVLRDRPVRSSSRFSTQSAQVHAAGWWPRSLRRSYDMPDSHPTRDESKQGVGSRGVGRRAVRWCYPPHRRGKHSKEEGGPVATGVRLASWHLSDS